MSTFIHGVAASENIDSSGERISIAGMDISSLDKDGVFNYEHKSDHPGQVVGKVLKAKKIFSEADCEDEYQLEFFRKCGVPYLYVMGELMDDYKESAKEVAGMFRYDHDRQNTNERNTSNFSIEGAKIEKVGMDIVKSIARKVTITVLPCNKAAIASLVPVERKAKKGDIDELFKTEAIEAEIFKGEVLSKTTKISAAPAPAPSSLGAKIGIVGQHSVMSHAKPAHYGNLGSKDLRAIASTHYSAGESAGTSGNPKMRQHHTNMTGWFMQAADRAERQETASATAKPRNPVSFSGPKAPGLHDPHLSGKIKPPGPIAKALDAGSGNVAPSQLTGGAALAKQDSPKAPTIKPPNVARPNRGFGGISHKPGSAPKTGKIIFKSQWLARAEEEYKKWSKREGFESFMSKRMPNLTKGEIRAIGQVMALNKSMTLEKALSSLAGYEKLSKRITSADPMNKAAGKDSIYTLILFDGCELHDILHCSHFATDDMNGDTYEKIKSVCDAYFKDGAPSHELEFNDAGTLGKEEQSVLFLSNGDPYKELFEKLKEVAEYKYPAFRPHISVTSNVDEFKGKASSLVISVNGEVKKKYDFKK